jgi:hypothetical protein
MFIYVFKWVEFKAKMAQIETFNLNENLMLDYDGNVHGPDDLELGSFEDIRSLVIVSISTPYAPNSSDSESIATPNILDLELEAPWELLKIQLTLQQKAWVPHNRFSLPLHFFTINDGSKSDPIRPQTMQCVICHYVSQTYSSNNTTKNKKGLIAYN